MTIETQMGCQGDTLRIGIHWFDHNNINRLTVVEMRIEDQDKPRTLTVYARTELEPERIEPDQLDVDCAAYRHQA